MTLARCQVTDLMGKLTQRRITDEGFLVAPANLSRAGNVQRYRADELGLDKSSGIASDRMIALYRPREEVFSADAMASFEAKTLTVRHPKDGVSADNWKDVAVGDVRSVGARGDYMGGELVVRDAAGIKAIQGGMDELSCGYSFDLDMTPGMTADGVAYDGCMKNLRGNHVAAVDSARGGPGCRVMDSNDNGQRRPTMALRRLVLDGISMELDETQASLVEKIVGDAKKTAADAVGERDKATARATAAETALETANKAHAAAVADAAGKLAAAEAKIPKPEAFQAAVRELTKVIGDAALLVPDFKAEGKTAKQIREEVLSAVLAGDEGPKRIATAALGGKSPAEVGEDIARIAFDSVIAARGTDAIAARDEAYGRALAGADDGGGAAVQRAGKPPRFVGMDAVNEAERLIRIGKRSEADAVLAEARQ